MSNFWKSLNLTSINWEIEPDLSWSRYFVITEISRTDGAVPNTNRVRYQVTSQTTGAAFQINNTKVYIPVVFLSINDKIKFLENIKQECKRTISWNKCRSEITTQTKNNNWDYLIDRTSRNINRLFVLSFRNIIAREPFLRYYMPLVEIKGFNELIDNKQFFLPASKKQTRSVWKTHQNITKWWLYNRKFVSFFISSKLL